MNGILAYYITLISSSSVSAIHGFIPTLLAAEEDFINIGRLKAAGFLLLLVIGAGIVLFVYTTLRKNMNRSRELRKKAGRTTFLKEKSRQTRRLQQIRLRIVSTEYLITTPPQLQFVFQTA